MAEEAAARARSAGTPDSVIESVQTGEFLKRCLRKAKLDVDLIQDVADACELNELDALCLGTPGQMDPAQAADQLFLMQDEAATVLAICHRQLLRAGVIFPGESYEYSAEDEWDAEPAPGMCYPSSFQHSGWHV
jgi:hypothetical protein